MNNLISYGASEYYFNEALLYPQYKLARVISQHKGMYKIVTEEGECYAEVSGKFRFETTRLFEYPAVGDFVMVNTAKDNRRALIHNVLTRKSVIERTAVGISNQTQVIAANVDIIFICMSLNSDYNLNRLERYLTIAWTSGAKPVVILTKADLYSNIKAVIFEIEQVAIGVDIIVTSCFDLSTVEKINSFLNSGVTASFIGSSGVGKSTLINLLAREEIMATNKINKSDKGIHTTTRREMLLLDTGATVIDTPGMRELGVDSADFSKSFTDIEELGKHCRFSDCTHTNEPACAVRKAIEEGELDERRLQNYIKIKKEARYVGLSSKEIETEKFNQMFKEIGGIKRVKQFKKTIK